MTLNEWYEWAMLKEMLEGCGEELCGVLLAMGVRELLWILLWRIPARDATRHAEYKGNRGMSR